MEDNMNSVPSLFVYSTTKMEGIFLETYLICDAICIFIGNVIHLNKYYIYKSNQI